jgi:hypothetical protein
VLWGQKKWKILRSVSVPAVVETRKSQICTRALIDIYSQTLPLNIKEDKAIDIETKWKEKLGRAACALNRN